MARILGNVANNNANPEPAVTINRIERVLAFMVVALIALSVLCFIAIIVATAFGVGADDAFSQGLWPSIFLTPYVGLPLAFVLMIVLFLSNATRRRRAAQGGTR